MVTFYLPFTGETGVIIVQCAKGRGRINIYNNPWIVSICLSNWILTTLCFNTGTHLRVVRSRLHIANCTTGHHITSQVLWTYKELEEGRQFKINFLPLRLKFRPLPFRNFFILFTLQFSISYVRSLCLIQFTWNFSFTSTTDSFQYPYLVEGLVLSAYLPCWWRIHTFHYSV